MCDDVIIRRMVIFGWTIGWSADAKFCGYYIDGDRDEMDVVAV